MAMQPTPKLTPTPQPQAFNALLQRIPEALLDELRQLNVPLTVDMTQGILDLLAGRRDEVYTRMFDLVQTGRANQAVIGLLLWAAGAEDASEEAATLHREIKGHNLALYMVGVGYSKFWSGVRVDYGEGMNGFRGSLSYATGGDIDGKGVAASHIRFIRG